MEPEVNSAANVPNHTPTLGSTASAPVSAPEPRKEGEEIGKIEENKEKTIHSGRDSFVTYSGHSSFNFGIAIAWLVALLSILATLYFWWLNKNVADSVADKKAKKDAILQEIQSPTMVKSEKDALDFKSSVSILSKAKKDRLAFATILPELNTKITNDSQLTALSITSDGTVSITGKTKSYRGIADLAMALKSWTKLSSVEIGSASMSVEEEGKGVQASFSITASISGLAPAVSTDASASTTKGGQ